MFKWQNIIAVFLIVAGALGFKWSDSIGVSFQSAGTDAPLNKQLASSISEKVTQSVMGEPAALYVELFSIAMLTAGVIWLTRRASIQQPNSRIVLDFSKKRQSKL